MKPPDVALRGLVLQWIDRAAKDLDAAEHLGQQPDRFQYIVAFHCQQAVEKYPKAVLVWRQIEFPKTHDIRKLLEALAVPEPQLAQALGDADLLTPFGVEGRYPGDAPELLPGGERDALAFARRVQNAVMSRLAPYLNGD
jgi:HEPN domain-containing protein